jgi:hypothetical protein
MSGKIFIVTHVKPVKNPPKGYDYIGVGNGNFYLPYSDKTGESISHFIGFGRTINARQIILLE